MGGLFWGLRGRRRRRRSCVYAKRSTASICPMARKKKEKKRNNLRSSKETEATTRPPSASFSRRLCPLPLPSINSVGNFATCVFNPILSPFPSPHPPLHPFPSTRLLPPDSHTMCRRIAYVPPPQPPIPQRADPHSLHSEGTRWSKCGVSHPTTPMNPANTSHSLSRPALPKTHDPRHHGLQQFSLREKHPTHKGLQGSFEVYTGTATHRARDAGKPIAPL